MSTKVIAAVISTAVVSLAAASPAIACKAAPDFRYESIDHDLPTCVTVEAYGDYDHMPLDIHNGCDVTLTIDVVDCPRCPEQRTQIEPHADEHEHTAVILEPAEPMQEPVTFRHHLSWSMEEASGDIRTVVDYQDNSDACKGLKCSTTGAPTGEGGVLALMLLGALRVRRRRYPGLGSVLGSGFRASRKR